MIIWAVMATILSGVLAALLILYRRQIKKICRQLSFLKKHRTNLRLNSDLPFPELNELNGRINEVLDQSRHIRRCCRDSEEALKETITSLSHDIRTPLTSLDGYFQLLAQSSSEEERLRYTTVIQSRITSLNAMLEELFTYTKLQNDQYELPLEQLDFSRCVCDTLFAFYGDFKSAGIEPETDFGEQALPVQLNEEAVRRILQNIVKNALEHGKNSLSLQLHKEGGQAVFRCRNTVENPDEIDMDQVSRRLYTKDPARSPTSNALGPSIARELAERMGGTLSAALNGPIFTVGLCFPLIPSQSFSRKITFD